uniref:Uncharacterized protein LOC104210424 n=1 Tax=Nicotiana sylvestris TaxID=4096 RepID=A0A1U7V5W0_NICSY|nr:PREDICTED: uncharacterized protein LOC104210424 [Nicotiana sylvestris]
MNHIHRSKLVLKELSNGVTNDSSLERILVANIDIPLHYHSGRNINRQQNVQEQFPDISLPQSSGSNVEQPKIILQTALQEEVNDIPASQYVEDDIEASAPENDVVIQQQNQTAPIVTKSYDRIPEEPNTEPINYDDALHDTDADKWVAAMKFEMESMHSNQVWDLVKPPIGVKPIGYRCIYKKKRGDDGKMQTYKARLVAKEFTQKEGIDYKETFSPITLLKSTWILISIAAHYDYEI